jgi:hypothetical protein
VNEPNWRKHFQKCSKVGQKNGRIMLLNVCRTQIDEILLILDFDFHIYLAPEYGSMTSAWKALMGEADASAEIHQNIHDELQNDVIPAIKSWQKSKYVKSMLHIKPTKDLDEEFKRVCI